MAEEQVRREIRRFVTSFPAPHGLRDRVIASSPREPRTPSWLQAAGVVVGLVVIAGVVAVMLATRAAVPPSTSTAGVDWASLESRPVPKPKSGVDLLKTCAIGAEFDTDRGTPPERFFGTYPASPGRMVGVSGPLSIDPAAPRPLTLSSTGYQGPALVRLSAIKGVDGSVGLESSSLQESARIQVQSGQTIPLYVEIPGSGCYALRIDAPQFSEILVFPVTASETSKDLVPVTTTADQVLSYLRGKVTGVSPLLVPSSVPATWKAEILATDSFYSVKYTAPDGRTFNLATIIPNPPPYLNQSHPNFRGDPHSFYEWQSAQDPRSDRNLLWQEPGSHWKGGGTSTGEVSFYLWAGGATDAEFWQFANSLHAV